MFLALKARNYVEGGAWFLFRVDSYHSAPTALPKFMRHVPGRCPGLLHFAPLALRPGVGSDHNS